MATGKPEAAQADVLSLPEMLRIMDVATALRHNREQVEEQLNFDELKVRLRAKMIEAAKVTGEEVTPEEVDAAIGQYYSRMHTFAEPPWSLPLVLAHLYVRRRAIAWTAGLLCAALGLWWVLLGSSGAPLSTQGRTHRQVEALADTVTRRTRAIQAAAQDPDTTKELARLAAEAETFRKQEDPTKLGAVESQLAEIEARLNEEYAVSAAFDPKDPKKRNVVKRGTVFEKRVVLGCYVVVQARRADGTVLTRRVHNLESNRDEDVTVWAEQIPEEVYNRLARDKTEDGVLNETAFAVKRRGRAEEEVVMPGANGRPLTRRGQITHWLD
jgi:hypothetical protein